MSTPFSFTDTVAENCLLNFIEQPITSAPCLLYEEERIVLICTIYSEGLLNPDLLDPSRISIKWYYNNGTESELTVGTNETRREGGNGDPLVISSILTISAIGQHDAVTLAQGLYYCRVNVDGWGLVSNSSQQSFVLDEGSYLQFGAICSEITFIDRESTCAVHNSAIVNPTTEDSSETLATINHQNVTDIMIMQEVDTTVFMQSTFMNQNKGTQEIWIYILVAVLSAFLIIIVVLIIFILQLILMARKSQATARNNMDHKLQHACMHA